jgi:hypothetical protein
MLCGLPYQVQQACSLSRNERTGVSGPKPHATIRSASVWQTEFEQPLGRALLVALSSLSSCGSWLDNSDRVLYTIEKAIGS